MIKILALLVLALPILAKPQLLEILPNDFEEKAFEGSFSPKFEDSELSELSIYGWVMLDPMEVNKETTIFELSQQDSVLPGPVSSSRMRRLQPGTPRFHQVYIESQPEVVNFPFQNIPERKSRPYLRAVARKDLASQFSIRFEFFPKNITSTSEDIEKVFFTKRSMNVHWTFVSCSISFKKRFAVSSVSSFGSSAFEKVQQSDVFFEYDQIKSNLLFTIDDSFKYRTKNGIRDFFIVDKFTSFPQLLYLTSTEINTEPTVFLPNNEVDIVPLNRDITSPTFFFNVKIRDSSHPEIIIFSGASKNGQTINVSLLKVRGYFGVKVDYFNLNKTISHKSPIFLEDQYRISFGVSLITINRRFFSILIHKVGQKQTIFPSKIFKNNVPDLSLFTFTLNAPTDNLIYLQSAFPLLKPFSEMKNSCEASLPSFNNQKDKCISCADSFKINDWDCVEECNEGYSGFSGVCMKCDSDCPVPWPSKLELRRAAPSQFTIQLLHSLPFLLPSNFDVKIQDLSPEDFEYSMTQNDSEISFNFEFNKPIENKALTITSKRIIADKENREVSRFIATTTFSFSPTFFYEKICRIILFSCLVFLILVGFFILFLCSKFDMNHVAIKRIITNVQKLFFLGLISMFTESVPFRVRNVLSFMNFSSIYLVNMVPFLIVAVLMLLLASLKKHKCNWSVIMMLLLYNLAFGFSLNQLFLTDYNSAIDYISLVIAIIVLGVYGFALFRFLITFMKYNCFLGPSGCKFRYCFLFLGLKNSKIANIFEVFKISQHFLFFMLLNISPKLNIPAFIVLSTFVLLLRSSVISPSDILFEVLYIGCVGVAVLGSYLSKINDFYLALAIVIVCVMNIIYTTICLLFFFSDTLRTISSESIDQPIRPNLNPNISKHSAHSISVRSDDELSQEVIKSKIPTLGSLVMAEDRERISRGRLLRSEFPVSNLIKLDEMDSKDIEIEREEETTPSHLKNKIINS